MTMKEALQNIRKKKDEMLEEARGVREGLRGFRPHPIQNTLERRVEMRRNSLKRRVISAKELLRINSKAID